MLRRKSENGRGVFGEVSVQAMLKDRSALNNFIKLYSLNMAECLESQVLWRELYL
jgi:hypothetical protein